MHGKMSTITAAAHVTSKCPFANADQHFEKIQAHHPTLASTGCTKEFCQAGRAIHTDEVRVGENRSLAQVESEALDFIRQAHHEGLYATEEAYKARKEQARKEIRAGSIEATVRLDRSKGKVGGNWIQSRRELEFGVRRAWRNSRKCIMRSHCMELELYDFRAVTSSKEMATKLLEATAKGFNNGNILPTAFVFPPRDINSRGPMIWNHQILQFAGYEMDDGSICGDPASVGLTKSIIALGWNPPEPRGRFDILPMVTMADHDKPYLTDIPADLCKLIKIRHPEYKTAFERLDLRWVPFPALCRLGFDIGGVQYTASPFIGWFMDAEIGCRDLADSERYNSLPAIVSEMGLAKGKFNDDIEHFEDLPEYDKLRMLSVAQAELNYAVHYSFLTAKVTMTDSLSASLKWTRYDDEFERKNGFRLPSDPFWLAPPQGAIIPIWHRGGSPNYQPKPVICRHVQDPVRAWDREREKTGRIFASEPLVSTPIVQTVQLSKDQLTPISIQEIPSDGIGPERQQTVESVHPIVQELICPLDERSRCIEIYFCSTGTIAEKLARRLYVWIAKLLPNSSLIYLKPQVEPLSHLNESSLTASHIILLVASSTGQGEIPSNGHAFAELYERMMQRPSSVRTTFAYSIFGNGDSRYSSTFNGAGMKLLAYFKKLGGIPLAKGFFSGDVAISVFPVKQLGAWLAKLEPCLSLGASGQWVQTPGTTAIVKNNFTSAVAVRVVPIEDDVQQYEDYHHQLRSTLKNGLVISSLTERQRKGSLIVDLKIKNETLEEMSCMQILPINSASKIRRATQALSVEDMATIDVQLGNDNPSYSCFFREFVDMEVPFLTLQWLRSIPSAVGQDLDKDSLSRLSVLEVLEHLNGLISRLRPEEAMILRRKICLDMPLLHTRTYSLASSEFYNSKRKSSTDTDSEHPISIMTKVLPNGRFSSIFLKENPPPSSLKYRIVDSICGPQLRQNYLSPFVIVATGAGFGPVRALLQWRIATAIAAGRTLPPLKRGVSLFLGVKDCDVELCLGVINEALALDLIDMLNIVISNAEKKRVFEEIPRYSKSIREKVTQGKGRVFLCANRGAEEGTRTALAKVFGGKIEEILGKRYLAEVF